ncbi:MAG: gamma-glutamyl-gamma-aminobutyrate hydrolase family protein [Clostridium sp.]|nr:gamma-glutamyl-gamma-aminobutyrate hydrolase family protein [Clostridium sp.]
MKKSKIGIVSTLFLDNNIDRISVSSDYINAIEKSNGLPIIIPITSNLENIDTYINLCDGFLFTGGIDINPFFYKETPYKNLGEFNSKLDLFQLSLMKNIIDSKKPFLAICRGIQILNVACGGTLYQDFKQVPYHTVQHYQKSARYDPIHLINIKSNSTLYDLFGESLYVNSFHHQCINKLGHNLKISALAPDNVIEAIEIKNYKFGIGVQWHPEMMLINNDKMLYLFSELIETSYKN